MTHIINNIYLSSYKTACDENILNENKIGCIFNVAKGCKNMYQQNYDYVCVPFDDDTYIPKNILDTVIMMMKDYCDKNVNILVHCRMGKSRSVFVVAYYLLKHCNMTIDKVITYIKSKKTDIAISNIFIEQLKQYHNSNSICVPNSLVKRLRTIIDEHFEGDKQSVTDDNLYKLITKCKKVKAIEEILKNATKFPKGRQTNYIISIYKKTNYNA